VQAAFPKRRGGPGPRTAERTDKNPLKGFPVEDENEVAAAGSIPRFLELRHAFSDRKRVIDPPTHCLARANAVRGRTRLRARAAGTVQGDSFRFFSRFLVHRIVASGRAAATSASAAANGRA